MAPQASTTEATAASKVAKKMASSSPKKTASTTAKKTAATASSASKKKSASSASTGSSGRSIVRSKSFKRIRGFLTGESRKERKARKAAEAAAKKNKSASSTGGSKASKTELTLDDSTLDDASTIYGVHVDDRSASTRSLVGGASSSPVAKKSATETKQAFFLKIVLLLLDRETRRFELLQLEFDSDKALVADVISQIPVSVTEETLREQSYAGVTGKDGRRFGPETPLAEFCKGNDVLVAVPAGVTGKECAKLAKPILSDDKVLEMLNSSGIATKEWKDSKKKKPKSADKTAAASAPVDNKKGFSFGSMLLSLLGLALLTAVLGISHMYISAPIKPGHVVTPGISISKCGLWGYLPTSLGAATGLCEENAHVSVEPGKVTMTDANKEVVWTIHGHTCPEDSDCVEGLQFSEDNTLILGGRPVKSVEKAQKVPLSPWPFAEEPSVRSWKF